MRRAAVAALAAGTAAVLTACGSGTSTSAMRPDAATQLQSDVLVLTKQAAARNWTGARTALSTLRADLAASVSAGAVDPARAAQIEATISQVAGRIPPAVTATPTPTATPTSKTPTVKAPAPKPPPPPKRHHHGGDG